MRPASRVRNEWVSYLRVSSPEQADKDLSVPAQRRAIDEYAKRHDAAIAHEFEEARSAIEERHRPAFRRMLEYALSANSEVGAIVVHHSSRFTRDATEARIVKSKLRKLGVRVLYVLQEVSDDPTGMLLEGIFELIDQYESQINGMRTAAAMREAVRQGFFPGALSPYGYCTRHIEVRPGVTRSLLVPDEQEAEVVREVFRLYIAENGAKTTARLLNQWGYRYRGVPWNKALVLGVISESAVVGTYYWGRISTHKRIPNPKSEWLTLKVEPIVDRAVYDVAQVLRLRREPRRHAGRPPGTPHLLTGMLRCAQCNASYQLETSGKGAKNGVYKYCYYNCRNFCRAGKEVCSGSRIPTVELDEAVAVFLVRSLCTPERVAALSAELRRGGHRTLHHRKVEQLAIKRRKTDEQLVTWELAQRAESRCVPQAQARISTLREDLRKLDGEIEAAHIRETRLELLGSLSEERLGTVWRTLIKTNTHVARVYLEHLVEHFEVGANVVVARPKSRTETPVSTP